MGHFSKAAAAGHEGQRSPAGVPDWRPAADASDVIPSERTPQRERAIAGHPSLKPQSFLRQVVCAALPLGIGVVADTFMGSGSTVAAAEAVGIPCVGVERHGEYYEMAQEAVPRLADTNTTVPRKEIILQ